jgi:hypothetical protein
MSGRTADLWRRKVAFVGKKKEGMARRVRRKVTTAEDA